MHSANVKLDDTSETKASISHSSNWEKNGIDNLASQIDGIYNTNPLQHCQLKIFLFTLNPTIPSAMPVGVFA